MTKTEQQIIANIIERLKKPNCGSAGLMGYSSVVAELNEAGVEAVPRIYLDTWVIPALEALIEPGQPNRKWSLDLAKSMSKQ